jgi:hypothetical protein
LLNSRNGSRVNLIVVWCLLFSILVPISNSLMIYTATVAITPRYATLVLWVNAYNAAYTQWTTVGTSPYLNAQDQPSNYGWSSTDGAIWGDFDFQDTNQTGTIQSVTLFIYAKCTGSSDRELVCTIAGTSYTMTLPTDWAWVNASFTSTLDTWQKINNAQLFMEQKAKSNTVSVDAAYIEVEFS